jgi:proline iminopeptidase
MLFERWGATGDEVGGPVAGDHLVPDARLVATRSIDLDAPPDEAFPWLVQMGFGRGGWYSYDWLDNLGRRSATRIHPEWQDVTGGDAIPGGPIVFTAAIVEAPRAFVLQTPPGGKTLRRVAFTLAFELRPIAGGTRLVTRMRGRIDLPLGRILERFVLGPGDGIMVRRQLLNLRQRTSTARLSE